MSRYLPVDSVTGVVDVTVGLLVVTDVAVVSVGEVTEGGRLVASTVAAYSGHRFH